MLIFTIEQRFEMTDKRTKKLEATIADVWPLRSDEELGTFS